MTVPILHDNQNVVATMTSQELVDFINIHEGRLGLTHSNFLAKVPKVLGEGGVIQFQDTYIHEQNGQTYPCYRFPKREACLMAMSYSYDLQAKVYDRMTALEARPAFILPDFNNPATAARAWADAIEATQTLALERDHAIKTKAQIGSRREATSMATASAATRECAKLRALMGSAVQSASILAVQAKTKVTTYQWQVLKRYCTAAGLIAGKSFNPGLQLNVNTYPAEAWSEVYGIDLGELFGEAVQA